MPKDPRDELSVRLRTNDDQSFDGRLISTGPSQVEVDFPAQSAPSLPICAGTNLHFSGGGLPLQIEISARVTERRESEGRRTYFFRIDHEGCMALANVFERRAAIRVPPHEETLVSLQLEGFMAPVEARLNDVSTEGISVLLPLREEEILYETESVDMSFVLSGYDPIMLAGLVSNRSLSPGSVRYGIEFLPSSARRILKVVEKYVEDRQSELLERFKSSPLGETA